MSKITIDDTDYASMHKACKAYNLVPSTVHRRISKGWSLEEAFELIDRQYSSKCEGAVYKIYNIINNKVYIGITTIPLDQRFKQHCEYANNYKHKTKFAKALRKLGKEKFFIKLLKKTQCKKELRKLEVKYINKFDSIKKGYNTMIGGSSLGRNNGNAVELEGVLYASQAALAEYLNISPAAVSRRIKTKVNLVEGRPRGSGRNRKILYRNKIYSSIKELSNHLGILGETLRYRLNNNYCLNGSPVMTNKKGFYKGKFI